MKKIAAGLIVMACAAASARGQSISFEDAKKGDEAKKMAFLDQELGKLVFDKEKNPTGFVKAWFYVANPEHKAKAEEVMKEEFKKDGREKFYEKEAPAILKSLECPSSRILPFYRETAPMAQRKCQGYLLVGNLFDLRDEAEYRSLMDDYLLTYLRSREEGLKFKDAEDNEQELNPAIPILRDIAHASLLNLYARSVQMAKIAGKARTVSDAFRKAVVQNYLASHQLFLRQFKKELKIWDDNNENTLQKEIVDFLTFMRDLIYKELKKAGVAHKEINKDTFEYALEGI